jgi:hypothetical protein
LCVSSSLFCMRASFWGVSCVLPYSPSPLCLACVCGSFCAERVALCSCVCVVILCMRCMPCGVVLLCMTAWRWASELNNPSSFNKPCSLNNPTPYPLTPHPSAPGSQVGIHLHTHTHSHTHTGKSASTPSRAQAKRNSRRASEAVLGPMPSATSWCSCVICTHTYTQTHTHTYTYAHTHTHTHTHTQQVYSEYAFCAHRMERNCYRLRISQNHTKDKDCAS